MIGCCCCCCEVLLLMSDDMGNLNHRSWSEFVLFLKVFMKNGSNGDFCWDDVLVQVLYGFESLLVFINVWTNFGIKFGLRGFKIGILGWKMGFSRQQPVIIRHGEWLAREASCTVTTSPVSCSCVFFTHFFFELASSVNMKVLDNWTSFPMDLVWH